MPGERADGSDLYIIFPIKWQQCSLFLKTGEMSDLAKRWDDAFSGAERNAENRLSRNYFTSVFDNGVEA